MGRRQVVRHQFLVLAFAGSNPAAPARKLLSKSTSVKGAFFAVWKVEGEIGHSKLLV
jgi:hypothetical protein